MQDQLDRLFVSRVDSECPDQVLSEPMDFKTMRATTLELVKQYNCKIDAANQAITERNAELQRLTATGEMDPTNALANVQPLLLKAYWLHSNTTHYVVLPL